MKYSKSVQCIDIGNTRTSIGNYENGIITRHSHIPTIDLIEKKAKILSPLLKYDIPVSYCSVVPSAEMELIKFAEDNYLKVFNLNISTAKKTSHQLRIPRSNWTRSLSKFIGCLSKP